jgi:hypothetical protein
MTVVTNARRYTDLSRLGTGCSKPHSPACGGQAKMAVPLNRCHSNHLQAPEIVEVNYAKHASGLVHDYDGGDLAALHYV